MYIIVDTISGKAILDYTAGNRAEFANWDEAKIVQDSINRYTNANYEIRLSGK